MKGEVPEIKEKTKERKRPRQENEIQLSPSEVRWILRRSPAAEREPPES
jgi:hypothetical protein